MNVFYISRVFSNGWSVLSQCNTQLRLLHLLYDTHVDFKCKNNITHFFYVLYTCTLILHGFLTNQRAQGPIYIIIDNI